MLQADGSPGGTGFEAQVYNALCRCGPLPLPKKPICIDGDVRGVRRYAGRPLLTVWAPSPLVSPILGDTMKHLVAAGVSLVALLPIIGAVPAAATPITFTVATDGAQVFPGPGDPDGTGVAVLTLDGDTDLIAWAITVEDVDLPVFSAHIHQAPAGVAGPIVIFFGAALSGSTVDADVDSVLANPANFYVDVHNTAFPGGAVRGQLSASQTAPEPTTLFLMTSGAAVLLAKARRKRAKSEQHLKGRSHASDSLADDGNAWTGDRGLCGLQYRAELRCRPNPRRTGFGANRQTPCCASTCESLEHSPGRRVGREGGGIRSRQRVGPTYRSSV
jgi:CHRD domain